MRYKEGHKEETRDRILKAAGKVFRKKGFTKATVEEIMSEADLTVGGFYAHFASKDDLFAEMLRVSLQAMDAEFERAREGLTGKEKAQLFIERYLSMRHRRNPELGCPMPPLLSEMARAKRSPQKSFEVVIEKTRERLAGYLAEAAIVDAKTKAAGIVSLCVGGLALARAVSDDVAEEILSSSRKTALSLLDKL